MHKWWEHPLVLVGAGAVALYWLSSRRVAAATVGGTAQPLPMIVLPGNAPTQSVDGATPGTDNTDYFPAWTGSGDPSNYDPYASGDLSGVDSIATGQPGSPTGPVVLTP